MHWYIHFNILIWRRITWALASTGGQAGGNHPGRDRAGAPIKFQSIIKKQCMFVAKKTNDIPVCTGSSVVSRPRNVLIPLCSSLVMHIWNTGPGLPSTREIQTYWRFFLAFSQAVDGHVEFVRHLSSFQREPVSWVGDGCWFSIQLFRHNNRTAKNVSIF